MRNISNKFHQGALTIKIFWVIFAGIALKLGKSWPIFTVLIHVHFCHPKQQTTGDSLNA